MFTRAIVKKPGKSYVNGLTTSTLGTPDYEKVLQQHASYIEALERCGVKVTILEADEQFPDSTFVEDSAVLTEKFAIITNPGAASRNGEIVSMQEVLKGFYEKLDYIQAPGTLDGGDVLQVENHFYVGLSSRTNEEGARQFQEIVEKYGYSATIVPVQETFHLKTGITYLGNNQLIAAGEFVGHPTFSEYTSIHVDADEEYSANCIRMNDYVIIPKGFSKSKQRIIDEGYQVIEVDMSEFRKQDGGLTCLSLRF